MRTRALSVVCAAVLALAARCDAQEPQVATFRIADEGSFKISGARASRGTGGTATVVVVLESTRGDRLFLRRAPTPAGGVQYVASMGGANGVAFTRRGEGTLLEAAGRSLEVLEADLARPTVKCWVRALVARVDPKLLEAAAATRLVKDATGGGALEDVYMPMTLLWGAADASDLRPRGAVRIEKGPFAGPDFVRLAQAAADELGRR
jgi:hypothetical protein